jgi:hypothetical protein
MTELRVMSKAWAEKNKSVAPKDIKTQEENFAHRNANAVASVCRHERRQALFDFRKGLSPAGGYMDTVTLDERGAKAVWVFVQVFQGNAFGADIAPAQYVRLMAANADNFACIYLDLQPAAGFAQGADSVMCS